MYKRRKLNSDRENSIAIGTEPSAPDTDGISIGNGALSSGYSVSIGTNAGVPSVVYDSGWDPSESQKQGNYYNVAIGSNSLAFSRKYYNSVVNGAGAYNVAVGYNAASSRPNNWSQASEPSYNVSVGAESRIGGRESVALGYDSEAFHGAVAIGSGALAVGSPGSASYTIVDKASVAIGRSASATGQNSVAIGHQSSATNESGIAIGRGAVSSGTNIAIGDSACSAISGSSNVCIGHFSGANKDYTANQHIYLGAKSKYNNNKAVLEVHNISDTIKTGAYSYENASGVVINGSLIVRGPILATMKYNGASSYDGNTVNGFLERERNNHNVYLVGQGYENGHPLWDLSDRRLKYVGKENTSGLDKIRQLKVFNYTFKKDEKKTPHVGVIAQDLQKIFPDAVSKAKDGFLRIRFEDMFYAMINAIKELDSRITALEKENAELKKRLEVLEAKIK